MGQTSCTLQRAYDRAESVTSRHPKIELVTYARWAAAFLRDHPEAYAIVAWSESGSAKSIRFASGKWQDAMAMSEPGVYVPEASLALDDLGRGFIVWAQGDDGAVVRRFE